MEPEPDSRFTSSAETRRFRERDGTRLAIGLIVAVVVHFAMFEFFPTMTASRVETTASRFEAVDLPPPVDVPPPPKQIARPATPQVSADPDISEDVTIAPTTFESNPVERLPPPSKESAGGEGERPAFIPYDVPPKLKNPDEVRRALERNYPATLKNQGVTGRVVLWLHVSVEGKVVEIRVHAPSRYSALNEAARDVARKMEFTPAMNRDKPTAVWVQQAVEFEVV